MPKFRIIKQSNIAISTLEGIYTLVKNKIRESGPIDFEETLSWVLCKLTSNLDIDVSDIKDKVESFLINQFEIDHGKIVSSKSFKRQILAQGDPLGALLGGPPMPAAGAPQPQQEQQSLIGGPIDNMAKLVSDADVETMIKTESNLSEEEIALKVWEKYGGEPDGKVNPMKVGNRSEQDENRSFEQIDKEKKFQDENEEAFKRLPKGKTLLDMDITLEDLTQSIKSMPFSIVQKVKGQAGGQQPGGMPGMGMASSKFQLVKLAKFQEISL